MARQCAAEDVDYPRYLLRMTELELLDRERWSTERRVRQAKFPVTKSLDIFDFLAIPSLNKAMALEQARCEFLLRKENVLMLGNSGTGKTHVALALGITLFFAKKLCKIPISSNNSAHRTLRQLRKRNRRRTIRCEFPCLQGNAVRDKFDSDYPYRHLFNYR